MRETAKVLLGMALATLIMYLVFSNVDWSTFKYKMLTADYKWVVYSILLSILGYLFRAYRWNILLVSTGYLPQVSRTLVAVLLGYLANIAIPRLGEVTRCGFLQKKEKVPFAIAIGTVVSERIIDILSLIVLIVIALMLESNLLVDFIYSVLDFEALKTTLPWLILMVLAGGLVVGIVIYYFKRRWRTGKIASIMEGLWSGITSIARISKPIEFTVATVLMWIIYYGMAYLVVFAIPETAMLDPVAGMMLLVVGTISIILPVPSGFGTYHALIAALLGLYGIGYNEGVFVATLLHTSQILSIIVFGTIAMGFSLFLPVTDSKIKVCISTD